MLYGFLSAAEKPAATKAYDDGKQLFDEAEALRAQVHKDHMPELVDLGAKALAKYKAALGLFDKGVAQFPKDWSK